MIKRAVGAKITAEELSFPKIFHIGDYGAAPHASATENTRAIQKAIEEAEKNTGGTVVVPAGTFRVYTIQMRSYVNLHLEKGAVLQAARTDAEHLENVQVGEGGNYLEPEVELMAGLQDHGHSYLANSLVYARNAHHFMISGEGRFSGAELNPETGYFEYILWGNDPEEPEYRHEHGHRGRWFGNKGIALKQCSDIVLKDFSFVIGGHFAVITEGVENILIENILLDTNRDALDLDACRHVTVRNSVFNSLTDDALVIKSSFGAGKFFRTEDILVEDCTVSGYDAGSVAAGTYEAEKQVAADRCGPTGRVKLGTESSCGYDTVTIRRVHFDRSRGFAIEAVDGSDATNIVFEDCFMEHISSSPIFLRAGDRDRYPVTGNSEDDRIRHGEDVRLDQVQWILPKTAEYPEYPVRRYSPSYQKDVTVTVDGRAQIPILNRREPMRRNQVNVRQEDGMFYVGETRILESEIPLYANAHGSEKPANIRHVLIRNVEAVDVDPRYPILLMGLMDSKLEDIVLENIKVTYRGGLSMEHAVEQRQLNTWWRYEQFHAAPKVQNLPWLVNTFFLKNEGLLPRVDYNPVSKSFDDDAYNVPELPESYPEPSNWGILPAYGVYIRHARNVVLTNLTLETETEDGRDSMVLDDVAGISVSGFHAKQPVTLVSNRFKRPTHLDFVPEYPYQQTSVTGWEGDAEISAKIRRVTVNAPAPGTPADSLYPYETVASAANGYQFKIPTESYPLPKTVFRPFFKKIPPVKVKRGEEVCIPVEYRVPALETVAESEIHNYIEENRYQQNPAVCGQRQAGGVKVRIERAPAGARYEEEKKELRYIPDEDAAERETIVLSLDDGVRKEYTEIGFFIY